MIAANSRPTAFHPRVTIQATPRQAGKDAPSEPLPDLVISRFEPSTYFPFPGDQVTFEVDVKNQGNASAGPFNVSVEPDKQRVDQGLPAGATTTVHLGPIFIDPGPIGETVTAFADCDHEVKESDDTNNKADVTLWNPNPQPPPQPPIPPLPPIPPPHHP